MVVDYLLTAGGVVHSPSPQPQLGRLEGVKYCVQDRTDSTTLHPRGLPFCLLLPRLLPATARSRMKR